jgi:hypothetical protein
MTLVPRFSDQTYTYLENSNQSWRTYFVDSKYTVGSPPEVVGSNYKNDGTIRELLLQFFTGNDDLRNDNLVKVTLKLKTGTSQVYTNVNLNARWLPNYVETVRLLLKRPVTLDALESIEVETSARGRISGDNWDMSRIILVGIGGGIHKVLGNTDLNVLPVMIIDCPCRCNP